jgi:Fur family ferric uptake transcriptional regulator
MTRQRQVILDEVRRSRSHPTADEVYDRVRAFVPKISLGTVYRNLDRLAEIGEIRRVDIAGGQRRYDGRVAEHGHVRCVVCGRVADVDDLELPELGDLCEVRGYEVTGYTLELLGYCPGCKRRKPAPLKRRREAK